jgi:Tfp pilus assembly protein PilO
VSSMSDRDRKIILVIVPLVVIVAYWFLLLAPKREEAATAKKDMTEQQARLKDARAVAAQASGDKTDFAADYGEIVRLGKAIPSRVDMPSLLVQLDRAAEGTDITFTKISQGERTPAPVAAGAIASVTPPPADGSAPATPAPAAPGTTPAPAAPGTTPAPVAAGGQPAASAPGTATEAANNAAATSNQANTAAAQSGVDATTSTSTGGGLPVGGGAATPTDGTAPVVSGGLETVPLELEFVGNFFHLADFFHDIKRFVHVANKNVVVNGRLVTIERVQFASDLTVFPRIKATLTAKVYLSPLSQGVTAGATPGGPAATTPAAAPATTTPAPAGGTAPAATPAPTAAATP